MAEPDLNLAALHDPQGYAAGRARLGAVWALVGVTSELPREDDCLRTTLGGRPVLIQRCAHRSVRPRQAGRGNGPDEPA